jgi:hypothetical protein
MYQQTIADMIVVVRQNPLPTWYAWPNAQRESSIGQRGDIRQNWESIGRIGTFRRDHNLIIFSGIGEDFNNQAGIGHGIFASVKHLQTTNNCHHFSPSKYSLRDSDASSSARYSSDRVAVSTWNLFDIHFLANEHK